MSEFAEQVRMLLESLVDRFGYVGIALAVFLENVFPPIPSEIVMPGAGMLVASGDLHLPGVLLASILGALLGMLVLYLAGQRAGDPLMRTIIRRYGRWLSVRESDYDRTLQLFGRYGGWIIFVGQWIPGVRSLIALPAGMQHMPLHTFIFWTVLGMGLRNTLLIYLGVLIGQHGAQALGILGEQPWLIPGVVLAGVLVVALVMIIRRKRTSG